MSKRQKNTLFRYYESNNRISEEEQEPNHNVNSDINVPENSQHPEQVVQNHDIDLEPYPIDPGLRKQISDYHPNDQAQVRNYYIENAPVQPRNYDFPQKVIGGVNRRFNEEWFDEYKSWLEYSKAKDEVYCLCCYLFRSEVTHKGGGGAFVTSGWSSWNKKDRLDVHVGGPDSAHNKAYVMYITLKNQEETIVDVFSGYTEQEKIDYKNRLTAAIRCVRWLLKMGLAFRGHDESQGSANKGNFLELRKFLTDNNAEFAKVIVEKVPKNLQVMSHKIQKDIAYTCAKLTSRAILKDLGDDFFGILVDESRDISVKEQMIIFLRYVDKEGRVQERFLGIVHVPDTIALTLKSAIDQLLLENGLTVKRIRGQGYDGASNMQGEFNGLKTLILRENQSAFSIHCFAHQLQLTLVAVASKQGDIASFFCLMSRLLNIVGASCRRRDILRAKRADEIAEQLRIGVIHSGKGLNQEISLQRPTVTRWSSHYKSLSNLLVMFSSVVETLEFTDEEGLEFDQKGEARIMGKLMESFDFVFPLHFMVSLLGITNDLSQALQRRDQDIINAMELVQVTKHRLQDMRNEGWETLLNTVSSFCTTHDISVPNMEDPFVLEGKSRRKTPRITNLHRYRVEIFYATIDFLLQELNNRFNEVTTEFLLCMACFNPSNSFRTFDKQKLLKLAEFYPKEFSSADIVRLGHQLENYIVDMRTKKEFDDVKGLSELSRRLVETGKHIVYPSVYLLLKLVLILPVATTSVERAFSSMNYIKNKLRNRMGDKWLNDCLMSYIEREISDNIKEEEIIQYFQRMKTRRLKL